jgi:hypothetical protein
MTTAAIDRLLAVLVVGMAGTGLLTLRAGSAASAWVYVAHGILAGMLLAAVALKVRRSVQRAVRAGRRARLLVGLSVTLVAAAALSGGYLWVASGEIATVGSWTVLTLHAWLGLALVPLVVVHLVPRRWRVLRTPPSASGVERSISRRAFLLGAAFGAVGLGGYTLVAAVERLRGGARRFTGSRFLPSGGIPPPTTFFGEGTPTIDPASWSLAVGGRVDRPLSLGLAELRALGEEDDLATLDCTSGWAIETTWRGVPLRSVLGAAGVDPAARGVVVRSVTGWSTSLTIEEAGDALLATSVANVPLPAANGAPVRLVVPHRRGLDWVRWVSEVSVG